MNKIESFEQYVRLNETAFPFGWNLRFSRAAHKMHRGQVWGRVMYLPISVTRFNDLLDFGQLFKAFGNN